MIILKQYINPSPRFLKLNYRNTFHQTPEEKSLKCLNKSRTNTWKHVVISFF